MILAVMNAIFAIAQRSLKNSGPQWDLNPWPRDSNATFRATELWSRTPLTLGAGHLWVLMFPLGMNQLNQLNHSFIDSFIIDSFLTRTLEATNDQFQRQWLHSSVGYSVALKSQTRLKSWILQASPRNWKNPVHNCDNQSFTWFHIHSSI